ncbi:hypothetical protein B0H17DRAFT_1176634 [Mycena rosella]|uniref:Uncharacterized protein n=1 Tax=Mycena rosella TaxID=1033263 RepID=A0AAD7GLT2_MYCRO|nr:hypothetical protein B0H17DRAFT_1176634 [Mycena rosella]
MAPSYSIADLPFNIEGPVPAPTKEQPTFFDTVSIASSQISAQPYVARFRGKRILLLGLGIFIAIALLLAGLFLHIFVTHEFVHQGFQIVTAAPLGSTLAIVHALAVFLILTVPFVVRLESYRLAWAWLVASADSGHNRLTPFQLGVIMNILYGAHFSALWTGLKNVCGPKKRTSYQPPLLRSAVFVLAFALAAAYGFVVLDIIFSSLSTTISFSQLTDYHGTWPQLSRQINSTMCATTSGALASDINLCGLQVPGGDPFSASLPEGLRTLTNNSATNAVAFGNDGTAFIVPASIAEDVAYYATSYGVFSNCQSITQQCVGSGPSYGPAEYLALSCPTSAAFNATLNMTVSAYPFGVLDANGNEYTTPYLVDTNPFSFGAVVASQAFTSAADTFVGNTGFFTHGNLGAFNVLTCSVTVRRVAYTYFNGTFTVDPWNTSTVAELDVTRGITAMTAAAYLAMRVPAAIEGAGLTGGNYAASFARELSRELIAFSASLYAPGSTQEIQTVVPVLGSRLPLVLLVLICVLIGIYCAFVLFLVGSAVHASSASPYTLLARNRLAEPLTAVHTAYARGEPHRTWEQTSARLFGVETGLDRLTIGPMSSYAGGLAFGVSRTVATAA